MGLKPRATGASLSAEMSALAAELAATDERLDYSVDSLAAFEAIVRRGRRDRAAIARAAAYFGETLRRALGDRVRWVDGEPPALGSGTTRVFPRNKVEKFLAGSGQDSPVGFAPVAMMLLGAELPGDSWEPSTERRAIESSAVAAFDAFFADPTLERLSAFGKQVGGLHVIESGALLAERGTAAAPVFYPFFAVKPEGRGWKRFDAGRVAARWVCAATDANPGSADAVAAELSGMLGDARREVRENAARALGHLLLQRDRARPLAALYRESDPAIRLGLVDALRSLVYGARQEDRAYQLVDAHVEVLAAALDDGDQRMPALEAMRCMANHLQTSIAPLLGGLREVLESGKPAQIETALLALTHHLYRIRHGEADWTDECGACVELALRHAEARPGAKTRTRVEREAGSALRALASLGDRVPEGLRRRAKR